jgi:intron-binding protein aquarius
MRRASRFNKQRHQTCRCLRGAEVIEIRDSQGALFNDFRGRVRPEDAAKGRSGTRRTLLLALDAAQYQIDVDTLEPEGGGAGKSGGAAQLYSSFNVVQRRKAKENNFKAVLESIRDLMTESTTIPTWMHDLFLGYGAPEDTQFTVCIRHVTCIHTERVLVSVIARLCHQYCFAVLG